MDAYKQFVRKNKDFVHSLESLANGITWLLPERFSNSEIAPEAVYGLLGIITSTNQYILDTAPGPQHLQGFTTSTFPWTLCISVLKDLEAVVEVAAQHFYGEDRKWSFIAITEAMKAISRLALLRDSGYKMLLQGGESINDALQSHEGRVENAGRPNGFYGNSQYQGASYRHDSCSLEARAATALSKFGENARMISDPVWFNRPPNFSHFPEKQVIKPSLSSVLSEKGIFGGLFVTGEILFILRPLIYVLFIRRFGIKSWIPWLMSLAVDATGMGILSLVTQPRVTNKRGCIPLSASEQDEIKRRKLLLALYIIRDPFFARYTRRHLENSDKYMSQVPLIGFLTGKLVELISGAQTRYTYTSGS